MTDPKENEEINEELSSDELKSVSGGGGGRDPAQEASENYKQNLANIKNQLDKDANGASLGQMVGAQLKTIGPEGSGSGMARGDWEKSK